MFFYHKRYWIPFKHAGEINNRIRSSKKSSMVIILTKMHGYFAALEHFSDKTSKEKPIQVSPQSMGTPNNVGGRWTSIIVIAKSLTPCKCCWQKADSHTCCWWKADSTNANRRSWMPANAFGIKQTPANVFDRKQRPCLL